MISDFWFQKWFPAEVYEISQGVGPLGCDIAYVVNSCIRGHHVLKDSDKEFSLDNNKVTLGLHSRDIIIIIIINLEGAQKAEPVQPAEQVCCV